MKRTAPEEMLVSVDPISYSSDIVVLSGNPVQNYNQDAQEFEPDRALTPCVIIPEVHVADPEGIMSGKQELSGAVYYEGAPKADGSNRILDGADYAISAEGCPAHSLKVKKNIPVDFPIEIFVVYYFLDKRTNMEVEEERSIPFYTTYYDSRNYSLKLDQPAVVTLDPLEAVENANGNWGYELNAQLYSGSEKVPDENAAYLWQVLENGAYREIDPMEDFFLDTPEVAGRWGKKIIVDYRFIKDLTIRCIGKYYEDTYPTGMDEGEHRQDITISVRMPALTYKTIRTKGGKIAANLSTPVEIILQIFKNSTGEQIVGKDHFFQPKWYAKGKTSNAVAKEIGTGMKVSFTPKEIGVTGANGLSVYAEVKVYDQYCAVMDETNEFHLTDAELPIIDMSYE